MISQKKTPSPYVLELIAVIERILSFAHTGNARVLCHELMNRLWVLLGIMYDGSPCLSPLVSIQVTESKDARRKRIFEINVAILQEQWPIRKSDGAPLMASKASIAFHYSKGQADVSYLS